MLFPSQIVLNTLSAYKFINIPEDLDIPLKHIITLSNKFKIRDVTSLIIQCSVNEWL